MRYRENDPPRIDLNDLKRIIKEEAALSEGVWDKIPYHSYKSMIARDKDLKESTSIGLNSLKRIIREEIERAQINESAEIESEIKSLKDSIAGELRPILSDDTWKQKDNMVGGMPGLEKLSPNALETIKKIYDLAADIPEGHPKGLDKNPLGLKGSAIKFASYVGNFARSGGKTARGSYKPDSGLPHPSGKSAKERGATYRGENHRALDGDDGQWSRNHKAQQAQDRELAAANARAEEAEEKKRLKGMSRRGQANDAARRSALAGLAGAMR